MSKQEWGNATWFLFHGLATKIKDSYPEEYKNILYYFQIICGILPCPDCKYHATKTNSSASLHTITSNENLKSYLWQFHNRVNKRLNKPYFSYAQHNNLYDTVKIHMIIPPFFSAMSAKVPAALMMDAFHRKRALLKFNNYLKANLHKFN